MDPSFRFTQVVSKESRIAQRNKDQLKTTHLSAIRSTMVSVGMSKFMTRSTWTTSSKCSAWPTVLGKPSRSKDLPRSSFGAASSITSPIINSSGTNFPSFMYCFASVPSFVPSRTWDRSKSPVEM